MKLFLLATMLFVVLLLQICYADEKLPTLQADAVRQHDIICDTRREKNYMQGAKRTPVREGYEYLWRHGGYWTLKAKETSRISCSNKAGIFVINETEEVKRISFAFIGEIAREIALTCYDLNSEINGELKDEKEGIVVLVSSADC